MKGRARELPVAEHALGSQDYVYRFQRAGASKILSDPNFWIADNTPTISFFRSCRGVSDCGMPMPGLAAGL